MKLSGTLGDATTPQEINNPALPGEPGYGWRYFDDGTVIDPAGRYYKNGQLVYTPGQTGAGQTLFGLPLWLWLVAAVVYLTNK